MNTVTVSEYLKTSEQILDGMRSLIVCSRPPSGGPDRMQVGLILTITEQFEAALRLSNAHMSTHAATHVRSMIEAIVVMRKLEADSNYISQMRYDKLHGEKRFYEGVLADPNILDQAKEPIRAQLEICLPEFNALHEQKFRPKKISKEFGNTNSAHLVGPYALLCGFSHNDIAVLNFRHQGDKSMVYKQDDDPSFVQAVFSVALIVLMGAADRLGRISKFPEHHFESVFTNMNRNWGTVIDKTVVK